GLLLVAVLAAGAIPQAERDALIALYNSTDGANWQYNLNWRNVDDTDFNDPGTECTWYGVDCDAGNLTVTEINLNSNDLSGSIPPELGNLTNIWGLRLDDNQLNGSIPPSLGSLSDLYILKLNDNQLSGNIPLELGDLSTLDYLNLESNQLSGSIPHELGNLSSLQYLWLSSNQLNGSISSELGNLTNLSSYYTDIGYNALWTDDPGLQAFLDLKDPDWNETQTVAPQSVATGVADSTSIEVSWSPIVYTGDTGGYRVLVSESSGGPYTLFDATVDKAVSGMTVTGLDPGTLYYFVVQAFTEAHANNNNIVESELSSEVSESTTTPSISSPERDALIALYNSTDGANWDDNTNWRNAVDTDFNDPGTECTWHGVHCDAGFTTVIYLRLYSNQLSGSIPPELGNLSNLSFVWLEYNQLSGSIPKELGRLSNLVFLRLERNNLSGSIPSEFGDLTSLQYMRLTFNQLSGSIPPELGNLASLQYMYLSSNQLSGSIPAELGSLTSLEDLGLVANQLTGSIPAELGNLTNLDFLSLGRNQLSGSIPPELGNLSKLQWLFLSENQLSGSIPPELGSLSSLDDLDLSANQLSGSIPPELANLSSLFRADIGYNALWTDNEALEAFLDTYDPDWDETQTIAPDGLAIASVADRTVWLEWTPITYTEDRGGYEVFSGPVALKAATSGGFTPTKSNTTFPVTGLQPGQSYDFTVGTFTHPHLLNLNTVESELTAPEMATTSDLGCSEPVVESVGNLPMTLTVVDSSFANAFEWSTGETTPSITVNPSVSTYYWVRVFGPGSCDEATVVYVPIEVFADGFESGDTSGWSSHVP
ncbi:MAG: hypothetical protein GY906_29440, partial [bacterium]|nr:hypothetical protein [bacterium]